MASDAQESGPLPGTGASAKFTQGLWITHFGYETGIFGDTDGSAFGITLPPSGDVAEVGSASIDSIAKVGGFPLRIPAGETQSLEIPPSLTGGTVGRTDLITARLDTASFTTAPGPVRLHRIAGTEGSATRPAFDSTLPSPFDVTIWAITRKQGEALNQATVVDLRKRTGRHYLVPADASLPANAPLGSTATRDGTTYRMDFVDASVDWVQETFPPVELTGTAAFGPGDSGWPRQTESLLVRQGKQRSLHLAVKRGGGFASVSSNGSGGGFPDVLIGVLDAADKPRAGCVIPAHGFVITTGTSTWTCGGEIKANGQIFLTWMAPEITLPEDGFVRLDADWWVA